MGEEPPDDEVTVDMEAPASPDHVGRRRWLSLTLLASLDVVEPLHPFLGWEALDAGDLRVAGRQTLRRLRQEPDGHPRSSLLSALEDGATGDFLVAWEHDAFMDAPSDRPHRAGWFDYLTAGVDLTDLPREASVIANYLDDRASGPLVRTLEVVKDRPLSREDALIYAAYGMDHDDVATDDPLFRVKYHHDVAMLVSRVAEWKETAGVSSLIDLRERAQDWLADRGQRHLAEALVPLGEIVSPC